MGVGVGGWGGGWETCSGNEPDGAGDIGWKGTFGRENMGWRSTGEGGGGGGGGDIAWQRTD